MSSRRETLQIALVGGGALVTGGAFFAYFNRESPERAALDAAGLKDLEGRVHNLSEWSGKILVLNFWATWCAPCREEIPELVVVRDKFHASGVEFVGIAIDQAAKVQQFKLSVPISYPVLLIDATGLGLMRTLGNLSGGLPFTAVLDRNGRVKHRHLGALTRVQIENQLRPMIDDR